MDKSTTRARPSIQNISTNRKVEQHHLKINPSCAVCILFHCILNIQNMVHVLGHKENFHTAHVLCNDALQVIFAVFPSNLSITHMHTLNHLFSISPKKGDFKRRNC